jgi:hypothetical protein
MSAEHRAPGAAAPPKEPGWYPVRANPNEQTYWDGSDWTRRRVWNAGTGWAEVGGDAALSGAGSARLSANPYAPHPATPVAATVRTQPGVTIGLFLLAVSAIGIMFGSVTTWISSSSSLSSGSVFGGITITASGTASGVDPGISTLIGINGYVTLIAGVVVLVFAGLMMVSEETSVRLVACLFSLVALGLSIFAIVRLVQKLNAAHPLHGVSLDVGWGIILVLGAAVLATLLTLFEATQNR